jgi:hypothetical protein
MTIDVNDIATDTELDSELGGQVTGAYTLRPKSWEDAEPARQFALDAILKLFVRVHPAIGETQILAYAPTEGATGIEALKDAVIWGAAARLYHLAVTSGVGTELFYALKRDYEKKFSDEVRRLGDAINASRCPDPVRRSRRVIVMGRR